VRSAEAFEIPSQMRQSSEKFNLVCCNFALHYLVPSQPDALQLFSRVHGVLQEGGLFAMTIVCSDTLEYRLKESGKTFGNKLYEVAFTSHSGETLSWGHKYDFRLGSKGNSEGGISHSEFVVPWTSLVECAQKSGFELWLDALFPEMFCRYAIDSPAVAEWYGKQNNQEFLELSPEEEEIFSLYRVTIFRKM